MSSEAFRLERVLFPIDLSEASRRAVPFVKAMVGRFESRLIVLHSLEIPITYFMPPDVAGLDAFAVLSSLRETRKSAVETFIAENFAGMDVVPEFAEGSPASEIAHSAEENKAELIMMPTHGAGTFRPFLLGSVAAKVLHDTHCPVWTAVHLPERTSAVAEVPRRILCAVDLCSDAVRVIRWATAIARQFGASVQFIHTIPGSAAGVQSDADCRAKLLERSAKELERLEQETGVRVQVTSRHGSTEEAIHRAAEDLKADLIVIGRGRMQQPFGRVFSHAYAVIREAACPAISV